MSDACIIVAFFLIVFLAPCIGPKSLKDSMEGKGKALMPNGSEPPTWKKGA